MLGAEDTSEGTLPFLYRCYCPLSSSRCAIGDQLNLMGKWIRFDIEPFSPLLKARYLAIPKSFIMYRVARLFLRFLGARAK